MGCLLLGWCAWLVLWGVMCCSGVFGQVLGRCFWCDCYLLISLFLFFSCSSVDFLVLFFVVVIGFAGFLFCPVYWCWDGLWC